MLKSLSSWKNPLVCHAMQQVRSIKLKRKKCLRTSRQKEITIFLSALEFAISTYMRDYLYLLGIIHFTVAWLVAKPFNRGEAKEDLLMIQTLLLSKCKLLCYRAN